MQAIVLISLLLLLLATASAGAENKIEFLTKSAFVENDLVKKNAYLVLLFCDDETCANNIGLFNQLTDLMHISNELGDNVVVKATTDAALKQFYGVLKAPKVFFFRNGHFVVYQGETLFF